MKKEQINGRNGERHQTCLDGRLVTDEGKANILRQQDKSLRDAIRQEEAELPQMPSDLNDRLMLRLEKSIEKENSSRFSSLSIWRGRGVRLALTAAASVALLLTIHYYNNSGVEPKEMPLAEAQTVAADSSSNIRKEPMPTKVVEVPLVAQAKPEKTKTHTKKNNEPQKNLADTSSAAEELAKAIARLEAEMESLEDSVSSAQMEKLIAADARLQRLVFNIVGKQVEQAMNQTLKDSTANYINF